MAMETAQRDKDQAYLEYILQTQQRLEGKRAVSPVESPGFTEHQLRQFKLRTGSPHEHISRDTTPYERKRRSLNLSMSFSPPSLVSSPTEASEPSSPDSSGWYRRSFNGPSRTSSISFKPLSNHNRNKSTASEGFTSFNRRSGFIGIDSLQNWSIDSDVSSARWSQQSFNSNRLSQLSQMSEQDRQLQDHLQQLARSENAKLVRTVKDLNISDVPTPTIQASGSPPQLPKRFKSLKRKTKSLSNANADDDIYVMTSQELEALTALVRQQSQYTSTNENDDTTNEEEENDEPRFVGPRMPGNIRGKVLSWEMTSGIIKTTAESGMSARETADLIKFVWAMFSRPENFSSFKELSFIPPVDVVLNLRDSLPGAKLGLIKLSQLIKSLTYAGFGFSVVFVQVLLIAIMVFVYIVGDVIISPFKMYQKYFSNVEASTDSTKTRKATLKKLAKKRSKKR